MHKKDRLISVFMYSPVLSDCSIRNELLIEYKNISKYDQESGLSTNLFSNKGTFLGINELNGIIPGCDEYTGSVIYTIQTRSIDNDT